MRKAKEINEKEILAKNPDAAKIFAENRKKLSARPRRLPKHYAIGLPYQRPQSSLGDEIETNEADE
jgi:hypothetical protein